MTTQEIHIAATQRVGMDGVVPPGPSRDNAETKGQVDQAGLSNAREGERQITRQEADELARSIQEQYADKGVSLKYRVLEDSGQIQVEMLDTKNDKVVRKIPQDDLLKLSASLKEQSGTLLDKIS